MRCPPLQISMSNIRQRGFNYTAVIRQCGNTGNQRCFCCSNGIAHLMSVTRRRAWCLQLVSRLLVPRKNSGSANGLRPFAHSSRNSTVSLDRRMMTRADCCKAKPISSRPASDSSDPDVFPGKSADLRGILTWTTPYALACLKRLIRSG